MKWDIKKSDELRETIAKDEKLMRQLSQTVDGIFKEHSIKLKGMSYVFEPRVFQMDPDEAPEVMVKFRAAMVTAITEDLIKKGLGAQIENAIDASRFTHCLPKCGGLDPSTLRVLEKYRIFEGLIADDSVPITSSESLMRKIVGNKKLLRQFSDSVFGILEKYGIKFKQNEGCVFSPLVFETPIFAQKVAVAKDSQQFRGFGPQVYAEPHPDPWVNLKIKPFPGIIDTKWGPTTGVIIDHWWWIGIPAPEMLHALDIMREIQGKQATS
jgi:hypothetical protein